MAPATRRNRQIRANGKDFGDYRALVQVDGKVERKRAPKPQLYPVTFVGQPFKGPDGTDRVRVHYTGYPASLDEVIPVAHVKITGNLGMHLPERQRLTLDTHFSGKYSQLLIFSCIPYQRITQFMTWYLAL